MAKQRKKHIKYSKKTADAILSAIASSPFGLQRICVSDDLPCKDTVFEWRKQHPEFEKGYQIAREMQADILYNRMLETILEYCQETDDMVKAVRDNNNVKAIQWLIGKLDRRSFGDSNDIKIAELSDKLDAIKAALGGANG